MKKCFICAEIKPLTEYHRNASKRDGLDYRCKACEQQRSQQRKEERSEWGKKYYQSPEVIARKKAATYAARDRNIPGYLLNFARRRAKQDGLLFTITAEHLSIPERCPVLNVPLSPGGRYAASVDRIDSSKGYVPGNVTVISRLANTMKNAATLEEIQAFCQNAAVFYEPLWKAAQG